MDYRFNEKLDPCPYNSSHQILPHRMAKHIIKCKKNYPNADMKVCPFSAVHVIPSHQYQAHLLECEFKALVEREIYCFPHTEAKPPVVEVEPAQVQDTSTRCEDWESECVKSSYKPEDHMIYKEFIRPTPPGLSKGARKQWRLNEMDRVSRLKSGRMIDESQSSTTSSTSETSDISMDGYLGVPSIIPKSRDGFIRDISRVESTIKFDQIHHQSTRPRDTAVISSLRKPTQENHLENHCEKSEKLEKSSADFIKEKRKLEKKLFEIKKLELLKENPSVKLTDQEKSKILLKKDIEMKLSNLMRNLGL